MGSCVSSLLHAAIFEDGTPNQKTPQTFWIAAFLSIDPERIRTPDHSAHAPLRIFLFVRSQAIKSTVQNGLDRTLIVCQSCFN